MNILNIRHTFRRSGTAAKVFYASLLLSCILSAVSGFLYYSQAKKMLLQGLQNQASLLCDTAKNEFISRYSDVIDRQLYVLVSSPQLDAYLMSPQDEKLIARAELEKTFLLISRKSRDARLMAFIDVSGNEVAAIAGNKRLTDHKNLMQIDKDDITARHKAELFSYLGVDNSPEFACTAVFCDKDNRPGFFVAARKQEPEAGGFGGIIVQHYDLSDYISNIAVHKIYDTPVVWIYGQNGENLLSPPQEYARLDPSPFLISQSDVRDAGRIYTVQCRVFENTKPLITVVCSIPPQLISSRLRMVVLSVAAMFSVLVIASLGLSVLISEWVSNPIKRLTFAAENISADNIALDLPASLTKSNDEVGALAKVLIKMFEKLNGEIIDRKKAEHALYDLNKELKAAVERLTTANRELSDFAHVAAHDLKAPLRAIGSLAGLILVDYGDKLDEQGRGYLDILVRRTERISELISGILRYSEVNYESEKQQVNLNEIIDEVIAEAASPENIDIIKDTNFPTILCNRIHIIQVFQNLISNAIKFMDKPRGYVRLSCVEENNFWKFSVADNGCGIEQKYFQKIFKIFQTLTRRDEMESTGIGLSVVRRIVEKYDGKIWVESEPEKGSTFYFTLPKQELEVKNEKLQANTVS
jgi:signal transduction histidine kinase